MKAVRESEYRERLRDAELIVSDEHGPKVLRSPDGTMYKLFRRKRLVSTTLWRPYVRRFERAATDLRERDIATVEVLDVFRVPHLNRQAVVYRELPGRSLRSLAPDEQDTVMEAVARFVAMLHDRGVYFRGLHFGNVIVRPEGGFGLVDISEVRCRRGPLPPARRARNFAVPARYDEDRAAIERFGTDRFIAAYLDEATLDGESAEAFLADLRRAHAMYAELPQAVGGSRPVSLR